MSGRRILVSFADRKFAKSQRRLSASALSFGFDEARSYSPKHLTTEFKKENAGILKFRRGYGYGIWKPHIIRAVLDTVGKNDVVFYSDAGCEFIDDFSPILDVFSEDGNGVVAFDLPGGHLEKHWTKRDLFLAMQLDEPRFTDKFQIQSGFIGWRNTDFARELLYEWEAWCCAALDQEKSNPVLWLVSDCPSILANYEGFREHRHNQSVWSLLCEKHSVTVLNDQTQYGLDHHKSHPDEYRIHLHRRNKSLKMVQRKLKGKEVTVLA